MLFEPDPQFEGLPEDAFGLFAIRDREQRRQAIIDRIHPPLTRLGEDLLCRLESRAAEPLHAHLPRLDWPRGYQPFCTWLALSQKAQGYQSGPQLNVGVHADEVAFRLGWDTAADAYGRFEFLGRHGDLGRELLELAAAEQMTFRVFAAAPWPRGSELVLETSNDLGRTFDEVRRRGVWWELGRHLKIPQDQERACSSALGREVSATFEALLPMYERMAGHA